MHNWEGFEEAVAIADAGTFVGAAIRLGLSTSHISRSVARLEDRLGAMLFHRTTRTVSLTDTGRTFIDHCRLLIQERDELLSFVGGTGEPQGELKLTCSIALGERFIAPIVAGFTEKYPRVSINLNLTNRVVDIVGEGYDIAIRTGHVSDQRLVGREIAFRDLETCAAPSYIAARREPHRIDDLKSHDCLVGTATIWHFIERGNPRIFTPTGRWRCNSGTAISDAAISGGGICQLPMFYVRKHIAAGRLRPVLVDQRSAPEPIWIVYPRRRHLLPKVSVLVQELELHLQRAINQN